MKRKLFPLLLLMLSYTSIFATDSKPNIIVIIIDDAGYNDFGFQGSAWFKTPNIDKLVDDGTKLNQAYVSNSVCAPSRAGLITGRYQNRFGFEYNLVTYITTPGEEDEQDGLDTNEKTIADYLKTLGYSTAAIGKWHLGSRDKHHPLNRGFDYFYGLLGGSRSFYAQQGIPDDQKLMRNWEFDDMTEGYATDVLTDDAIVWMEDQIDNDTPFFTYLSYTAVHSPYQAKSEDLAEFATSPGTDKRKKVAAMTYNLDTNIGKLVTSLKNKNAYDNTLIFFVNDNGGPNAGTYTSNYPLRGQKSNQYEGGLRVPMAMVWKDKIPAKTEYNQQVITLDILPTAVKAAGGELPSDVTIDGADLVPYLIRDAEPIPDEVEVEDPDKPDGQSFEAESATGTLANEVKTCGFASGGQLYKLSNDEISFENITVEETGVYEMEIYHWAGAIELEVFLNNVSLGVQSIEAANGFCFEGKAAKKHALEITIDQLANNTIKLKKVGTINPPLDRIVLKPKAENTSTSAKRIAEPESVPHEYLFWRKMWHWSVVNDGTYKVIINAPEWTLADADTLLYNLSEDISEQRDIFDDNKELAREMVAKFDEWNKEMVIPSWIGVYPIRKWCGWTNLGSLSGFEAERCETLISLVDEYEDYVGIDDIPTSIEGRLIQPIQIYPNPSRGLLNIEYEGVISNINILNMSGQTIKTFDGGINQINVSDWKKGVYLIKIHTPTKVFTQKLLLQ